MQIFSTQKNYLNIHERIFIIKEINFHVRTILIKDGQNIFMAILHFKFRNSINQFNANGKFYFLEAFS